MKKHIQVASFAFGVTLLTGPVWASPINLRINNQLIAPTVEPFEQDGTTLVPIRIVSENLGAKVGWNSKTKTITIIHEDTEIILTIGSKAAQVNGITKALSLAPQINGDTTMVPIRFVSENLKCIVNWDKELQIISVNDSTSEYQEPDSKEKVSTVYNPEIINGKVYASDAQIKEWFGVTITKSGSIKREDVIIWMSASGRVDYPQITRRYVPCDDMMIKKDNVNYYPLEFVATHLNGGVSYDNQTKRLTIVSKGIKEMDLIEGLYNDVKGYVKWADGSPAKNVVVRYYKQDGQTIPNPDSYFTVQTDENGYYEFKQVDTQFMPYISIGVKEVVYNGKKYEASIGTEVDLSTEGGMIKGFLRVNSKRTEFPVMYLYENIYD